jgi:hypothetical protein
MSIKCGNCGKHHDTVLEVKACHANIIEAEEAAGVMDALSGSERVVNPPSDRQVTYMADLLAQHDWPDELTEEDLRAMDRSQVSSLITRIKARPRRSSISSRKPQIKFTSDVPAGRYAIKSPGDTWSAWVFLQVDKPTEGDWAGNTFVKMLIGSPGDYKQQRLHGKVAINWLKMIEEVTPRQASIDFGLQSGSCGVCHSPLTNEESLKLGIGPVCRNKMGW